MKVKLCGFSEPDSLKIAIDNGCDFAGFVFFENSVRNISLKKAETLAKVADNKIKKVAVVVNENVKSLQQIDDVLNPDYFQFHGDESIDYIQNFKKIFPQKKIIKAFRIANKADFANANKFNDYCDNFLFDSYADKNYGGSGNVINWDLLKDCYFEKEWFLSGGLNINNIDEALAKTKAKMVDISSGIEEVKGKKSSKLIIEILAKIKQQKTQ